MGSITYRDAGVDIDAGDALVERVAKVAARTRIPEVLAGVGGFAGLCQVPSGIDQPVLVSGTDGVGTKLKLVFTLGAHDQVGQDLVAMCVNDVLTCGARPLFFLDYFATGRLSVDTAARVIEGIARACEVCGCTLLGGETAEMPGMYADGEYDLAGFAVGVVGKSSLIDGQRCQVGDVLLGLPSSGVHSNGYSLVRRVIQNQPLDAFVPSLGTTLGAALMTPTRLYAPAVRALLGAGVDVKAMSHITGGGLPGNVPRVLPDHLGARIHLDSFPRPPVFDLLAAMGPVDEAEMRRTFNLGLGYIVVVPASAAEQAMEVLRTAGEVVHRVGEVTALPRPDVAFEERLELVGAPVRGSAA